MPKVYLPKFDIEQLGRHFNVTGAGNITRQYTLCRGLQQQLFRAVIEALRDKKNNKFDPTLLDNNEVNMCIKTYNLPKGLSRQFFLNEE